jgi:hypothetical protein
VIDLGDPLTLTLTVRDPDTGQLADATSVAAVVTLPDLTTSPALTVTHPSLGEYRAAYTPTVAGLHQVVWTASGANAGTHTESFGVSAAEPALPISLTEARRILGVGVDAARDELIRDDLRAALGHIERHTGQTCTPPILTVPRCVSVDPKFAILNGLGVCHAVVTTPELTPVTNNACPILGVPVGSVQVQF